MQVTFYEIRTGRCGYLSDLEGHVVSVPYLSNGREQQPVAALRDDAATALTMTTDRVHQWDGTRATLPPAGSRDPEPSEPYSDTAVDLDTYIASVLGTSPGNEAVHR